MAQLTEKLLMEPWILFVLLSWPVLLYLSNFIIHKVMIKRVK